MSVSTTDSQTGENIHSYEDVWIFRSPNGDAIKCQLGLHVHSDVKRGQNLEAEAEAEVRATRPRPKIIMKKYQIMINNIWFKIIAGKINKIPEPYTIFARKMPD